MKNRKLVQLLRRRLAEKEPLIQVLVGPRQIGKTTMLKAILGAGDQYYSADESIPITSDALSIWWKQAQKKTSGILAIDEIQKIPDWSHVVKSLWDKGPKLKVVLTGSSALLMEKGLKESLAGRFELIRAEHWNYSEAKSIFGLNLKKYIEFGCYPGAYRFLTDSNRWANYIQDSIVEPVLGKDLLQLHPVENPALLRQVFGLAIRLPAQIISLQKLQGQLQKRGSIPTLQHYLNLLSQSFLVSSLEKYTPSVIRRKKSSPKLIVHDNGLMRAFERPVEANLSSERFGRYFENSIGARFIEAGWNVFYWKERSLEVDFIVIGPNDEHWALEVKSNQCHRKDIRGVEIFCKRYPEFEPQLISLVGQKFNDISSLKPDDILSLCRSY